jgi:hypothetical protein
MTTARRAACAVILTAVALVLAACGSNVFPLRGGAGSASATTAPAPVQSAGLRSSVAVIKSWSAALRRGDVRAAARYFQIPSVFYDGPGAALAIRSFAQAEAANAALPCGARLISASRSGRYVNALFGLTGRPGPGGSSCTSGTGQTARTDFLIRNGRIVQWLRAPDQPGDNGSPPAPRAPSTAGPTATV